MTPQEQAHFRLLKVISEEPDISQQALAERLGISVGKANYLIKALVAKGLVKFGNFQRTQGAKTKLRKVAYLLTPQGIEERIRITRIYLSKVEEEYEALKAEVAALDRNEAGLAAAKVHR